MKSFYFQNRLSRIGVPPRVIKEIIHRYAKDLDSWGHELNEAEVAKAQKVTFAWARNVMNIRRLTFLGVPDRIAALVARCWPRRLDAWLENKEFLIRKQEVETRFAHVRGLDPKTREEIRQYFCDSGVRGIAFAEAKDGRISVVNLEA